MKQDICTECEGTGWLHYGEDTITIGSGYKHDLTDPNYGAVVSIECEVCNPTDDKVSE